MAIRGDLGVSADQRHVEMTGKGNDHAVSRIFVKLSRESRRCKCRGNVYVDESGVADFSDSVQPIINAHGKRQSPFIDE